jgi:hypothetical protein
MQSRSLVYFLMFLSTCSLLVGQESKPQCQLITDQEMKTGSLKVPAHFEGVDSKSSTVTFKDADGKTQTWSASDSAVNEATKLHSGELTAMLFTMPTGRPLIESLLLATPPTEPCHCTKTTLPTTCDGGCAGTCDKNSYCKLVGGNAGFHCACYYPPRP